MTNETALTILMAVATVQVTGALAYTVHALWTDNHGSGIVALALSMAAIATALSAGYIPA